MTHRLHRTRLAIALLVAATGAAGCTPVAAAPTVETHVRGRGAPVAVLQSGLGDGLSVWRAVQQRLEGTVTTFAYDRPGQGGSAAVAGGRSPCAIAEELHAVLAALDVRPPYVLVGHSLGGLDQVAYAQLYPDEVAGLVLLEPAHPGHWATLQHEVPLMAWTITLARAGFGAAMRREFDDQTACNERLSALPVPAVPVRLLVRERYTGLEAGAFEAAMRRLQADWAERLRTTAEPIAGSGHYVQRDRPDAVAEAITALVSAVRHAPPAGDPAAPQ